MKYFERKYRFSLVNLFFPSFISERSGTNDWIGLKLFPTSADSLPLPFSFSLENTFSVFCSYSFSFSLSSSIISSYGIKK
jgi:hypothetical protein